MAKIFKTLSIVLLSYYPAFAQEQLTREMLEQAAIRFTLNKENQLQGKSREQWSTWIAESQFVGLAEVHNSVQLSLFTEAILGVLEEKGFKHFAIEMGPNAAEILQEQTRKPEEILENIRVLNRKYGKSSSSKTPMIFVNKVEDAEFVREASQLGFDFWGLDQEFAGSYEMLLDRIYENASNKNVDFESAYQKAKNAIRKVIFKKKYKGRPVYCWYNLNEEINYFFSLVNEEKSQKIIQDMRSSWDIYCKSALGQGSNQKRANYMKTNFIAYYDNSAKASKRVFLKLGGVHLTRGLSHFGVEDIGKFLADKAGSGFLSIRHLIPYRNGKSNVGKSSWKSTSLFLEIGRKDIWTAVDLRPFRRMMESGELKTSKSIAFELLSYDILLLSPDDQYPTVNY